MANRTKWTPSKKAKFLAALAAGYSVTKASKAAGWVRQSAYTYRNDKPDFAAEWDDAYEQGTDVLEDELHDSATGGDTTALIFALKSRRPEKYRERYGHEITGPGGTSVLGNDIIIVPACPRVQKSDTE